MKLGALEAGGTKMCCAIADENGNLLDEMTIRTTTPEETIPPIVDYFKKHDIDALGIGSFGPVSLNEEAENYGAITSTPKLAWRDYNVMQVFKDELGVPIGFDTDVNGSMLGEATWGQAKGKKNAIYVTIGTGIGAGVMINGELLHGMLHPEAGHILMRPREDDTYKGKCPYHGQCLEGLAAGPAIEERWGERAENLYDREEVWDLEAYYLAQACVNYIMTYSPEMIILGGGVMHKPGLIEKVREKTTELMNGYIQTKELEDMDSYIVLPSLNDKQGLLGAARLGEIALEKANANK